MSTNSTIGAKKYKTWYLIDINKRSCVDITKSLVIGREGGDVNFPNDKKVSRLHFAIELRKNNVFIKDLGSTNGTRVNGQIIKPQEEIKLSPSDEIKFGSQLFVIISQKQFFDKFWEERSITTNGFTERTEINQSKIDHILKIIRKLF